MIEAPEPLPPLPAERDQRGRFAPGNRASRGNAVFRRQAELHQAVRGAVTDDDLRKVFRAMLDAATGGDVPAASMLTAYCIGKPREAAPDFNVELPGLDTVAGIRDAQQRIAAAAAAGFVPVDIARQLADLVDRVGQAGAFADLERRLDELQERLT